MGCPDGFAVVIVVLSSWCLVISGCWGARSHWGLYWPCCGWIAVGVSVGFRVYGDVFSVLGFVAYGLEGRPIFGYTVLINYRNFGCQLSL